jgi:hypothetical protein
MLNGVVLNGKLAFDELHGRLVASDAFPTVLGLRATYIND